MKDMFNRFLFAAIFLLFLTACNQEENSPSIPTATQETVEETESNSSGENYVQSEGTLLSEEETVSIVKELFNRLHSTFNSLGEENNWNFENPGDYEVAKPDFLSIATEQFADKELSSLVEEYYCNCDSVIFPSIYDHTIRLDSTDIKEGSFTVTGINLRNFISGLHEVKVTIVKDSVDWKINEWEMDFLEGVALNLTPEEVQQAYPHYKLVEETTYNGEEIYKLQSENASIGVSKKDGTLYEL